jgi:O-antigen/teichoic acid export membrane protein
VLVVLGYSLDVTLALALNTGGLLLAVAVFAVWLRPRFTGARAHIATFVSDARAWGFQMWLGRVLSIGTYNMDVLMVAAFADAEATGFYALAGAICGILGLPIVGFGAALYPRMARAERLDPRWLAASWAVGGLGVLGIVLLVGPVVHLLFSDEYDPVIGLAVPLGLAQAVRGATTIYNTFMSAHALGKELRNTALVLTGANVVLNFALIPPFGAMGAAWASLTALVINFLVHVVYYRRYMGRRAATP